MGEQKLMIGGNTMNVDEQRILSKSQMINHWSAQKIFYHIGRANQRKWYVKRGEVYFVDLGENVGSEENKLRPVVVIQSDAYNFHSPTFTCAIITTSNISIPDIQVAITGAYPYVDNKSNSRMLSGIVDLGQIKTIGKERIVSKKICQLSRTEMEQINSKLFNAVGLTSVIKARDNTISSLRGRIKYLLEK